MLILALETTAEVCGIAIRSADGRTIEREFPHEMHLSERLVSDVDAILGEAGIALSDIDGFAVGIGPGSFTGARIGVMTVKTWASILNKPSVGIASLEAVAFDNRSLGDPIAPIIRARLGSVYTQVYRMSGDVVEAVGAAEMITLEQLVERLGDSEAVLCGDGLIRYGDALKAALGDGVRYGRPDPPRASTVAILAASRFARGAAEDPLTLAPLYVASPQIGPPAAPRS